MTTSGAIPATRSNQEAINKQSISNQSAINQKSIINQSAINQMTISGAIPATSEIQAHSAETTRTKRSSTEQTTRSSTEQTTQGDVGGRSEGGRIQTGPNRAASKCARNQEVINNSSIRNQ